MSTTFVSNDSATNNKPDRNDKMMRMLEVIVEMKKEDAKNKEKNGNDEEKFFLEWKLSALVVDRCLLITWFIAILSMLIAFYVKFNS